MTDFTAFSIIIPVLNEQKTLPKQLSLLQGLREAGHELIVVDGGSDDNSVQIATPYVDQLIQSEKGRARQMNKGAATAKNNWLLFLHVDTQLPDDAMTSLQTILFEQVVLWGRFDVRLSGQHLLYKIIAWFMNKRSRLTGIATGDQAMFVEKSSFNRIGGFPDIPLMEDIALSQQLKKISNPTCLPECVITSSRRWHNNGIIRTILVMWTLRLRYFFGVNPVVLAEHYNRVSK